ncbi:MAG: hypothetical protein K0R92_2667 [Lachnospiraceae bacterium]|jgi:S-formylglutathione hydrolase FrmB|nr:hypothetical protein [Lachnospiraceae bacterium]
MAYFEVSFFSPTLNFNTEVNVIIPTPNSDEILNNKKSDYLYHGAKFQVLYLLHGAYGDYSDWMRLTSIEKYAQDKKLAVVMPSASNSFYQDMYRGSNYLTYLTEELPQFIEGLFPISSKKENTFVAGLSMGGYGAAKLALSKPEKYGACASLSGALDLVGLKKDMDEGTLKGPFRWDAIFEKANEIEGSDADLFALIKKHKENQVEIPAMFITCGKEDFIYKMNCNAKNKFEELGVEFTYEEHPGIHDWDYWDTHIHRVLDWLPLTQDSVEE